jgi:OmcA/MtrC family decaheme c-type cytochrome
MSHAMEFAYPQSMANCVTCHEGKLDVVLTDANFTVAVCKSCHAVTGTGGAIAKRAPPLADHVPAGAAHTNLYAYTGQCNTCHAAGNLMSAPTFKDIHSGRVTTVFAADGSRYSDVFKTQVDAVAFDQTTNVLTVDFTVTKTGGAAITQTAANVVPMVVVSLYGYGTKDFLVGGHGTHTDGQRNLEATAGTAHNRITFSGTAPVWKATINLNDWDALIGTRIERAEVGILPKLYTNPADTTSPMLAVKGVSQTVDLVGTTAAVADAASYGKAIVKTDKCNACHEALGTTFHNPSYGSAGVVGCRLCHIVGNGGSHLEMQSRSIDSYVHSIHSMQPFDIGDINFGDAVAKMRYEHHVESTYPSFSRLNCVSCHEAGTFNVPSQALSLPGVLSASDTVAGRAISGVPSYVVGPASRACGGCHRAELVNEDDAGELAAFNQHTALFGTLVTAGTGVLDGVTQGIMARVGGPAVDAAVTVPAGTQIESCSICHPDVGADHQALFDTWTDGL